MTPSSNFSPEEVLAVFLEAHPDPSPEGIEALCSDNPDQEESLRRLLAAHRAMLAAFPPSLGDEVKGLHRPALRGSAPSVSGFRVSEAMMIGDFKLVRLLGRGGMGEVWEAEQVSLSRPVALKLLLPERFDTEGLEFFAREARAGGRLSHPGVVSIYGTGEDEGLHWIAMELVEDACDLGYLLEEMRRDGELLADYYLHVAKFIAEAADALDAVHAAGIIHRDLKPGNLLVTPDDRPKVLDFGLAKLVDERSISIAGDLVGTYFYMSPEQLTAKRVKLDARTDIFSLGVVLYEMLALVRPFDGDTTEQVAYKILMVDPSSPDVVRSKVPRDLAVICVKAIEKDRDRRYQSMADLAADLRRFLSDEPILAKPPGAVEWVVKWLRRNPAKSAMTAVVSAAMVVIVWLGITAVKSAAREALRSKELQQVVVAHSTNISGVDAEALGGSIREMFLEQRWSALERKGGPNIVLDAELATMEELLVGVDFTGMALGVLQREVFDRALQELRGLESQPLVQAELLRAVAVTLRKLGLLDRAAEPHAEALEIRRRELGNEHPDTLDSISDLGLLFLDLGRFGEAEPLLREALEGGGSALGVLDQRTLTFESDLGLLLKVQGRFDEAEPLLRGALEGQRRILGGGHQQTLLTIARLGQLRVDRGYPVEAELLLSEAVEGQNRTLGNEHPDTLSSVNSLALLYQALGDHSSSEPLFVHLLESRRRVLGNEHQDTLEGMRTLGLLYWGGGRLDEAVSLMRENLDACRRTLGDEHWRTLISVYSLGVLLEAQGKLDEAEPLYREALSEQRRTLGDDHPDTLISILELGGLLRAQGKLDESESHLREAMAGSRHILGAGHPFTLRVIGSLGLLLKGRGLLAEAEPLFREALKESQASLGTEHPEIVSATTNLGLLLHDQGRLAESEQFLRKALVASRLASGDEHLTTLMAIGNLAFLLKVQGRVDEAVPLLVEALEGSRRGLGGEHPFTLALMVSVGLLHRDRGEIGEAVALLREVCDVRLSTLGADNAVTLISRRQLGSLLYEQGKLEEARQVLAHTVEAQNRTLGEHHPESLLSQQRVEALQTALGELPLPSVLESGEGDG